MVILLAIVTIQSLITALLIYLNKKNKNEDFLLSLFFAVFFVHLSYKIILLYSFEDLELFEKFHGAFSLLYAPINYLYTLTVLEKKVSKRQYLFHSIPFIFGIFINALLFNLALNNILNETIMEWYTTLSMLMFTFSFIIYSLISLKLVSQNKETSTSIVKLKLKIIRLISFSLLILSVLILIAFTLKITGFKSAVNFRYLFYILLLILFFMVIHIRFKIFFETQKNSNSNEIKEEKYKNYDLDILEMDLILEKVNTSIVKRKMFLDSEFNLDILSLEIKIPKIKITQALNIRLNMNFYQYVNNLRVEESKKLIDKTSNSNYSTIGYQSGFKNKSTFYKYFRQNTGITPSEYKKK
jgi:AraC-like DNA-binding protein